MRFRLSTIAYVFALLAAALATFGAWGIVAATLVLTFWVIFYRTPATPVLFWLSLSILLVLAVISLTPAMASSRSAAMRNVCLNNVKQLFIALEAYHHRHGSYPPAYIADDKGRPMHSWRVLLLPYLGEEGLYREYKFEEPWDGPNNRKLWDLMPAIYGCHGREWLRDIVGDRIASTPSNAASYVAIVDESTAWPGARPLKRSEITDGPHDTVLLLECSGLTVPWTAPVDLTLDQAIGLFETNELAGHPIVYNGFFSIEVNRGLYLAGYADGYGKAMRSEMPRKVAQAMFTVSGGEDMSQWDKDADLSQTPKPQPEIYVLYERVYAFAAFVFLALLPGLRLWFRRRTSAAAPASC